MGKVKYSVTRCETIERELSEGEYRIIVELYDGDVLRYIKDLEPFDAVSGVKYDKEEIRNDILDYYRTLGIVFKDNWIIDEEASYPLQLSKYKTTSLNADKSIAPLALDEKLAIAVCPFAGINHPNDVINYIKISNGTMVATDTRALIIVECKTGLDLALFVPPCFMWTLDKGGKISYDKLGNIYLDYEKEHYSFGGKVIEPCLDLRHVVPQLRKWKNFNESMISKEHLALIRPFGFTECSQEEDRRPIYFCKDGVQVVVQPKREEEE